jgi:hypothetical protein
MSASAWERYKDGICRPLPLPCSSPSNMLTPSPSAPNGPVEIKERLQYVPALTMIAVVDLMWGLRGFVIGIK